MGGRGSSSGVTNKNSNILSFERFMKLDSSEKKEYFQKMVENAYGDKLKAGQTQDYLRKIGIEKYDYWASFRDGFDFKKEYKKIIKLDKIAQERIKKQKKENEERIKRQQNSNRSFIRATRYGFDADTDELIRPGDAIVKVNGGWSKIDNAY